MLVIIYHSDVHHTARNLAIADNPRDSCVRVALHGFYSTEKLLIFVIHRLVYTWLKHQGTS